MDAVQQQVLAGRWENYKQIPDRTEEFLEQIQAWQDKYSHLDEVPIESWSYEGSQILVSEAHKITAIKNHYQAYCYKYKINDCAPNLDKFIKIILTTSGLTSYSLEEKLTLVEMSLRGLFRIYDDFLTPFVTCETSDILPFKYPLCFPKKFAKVAAQDEIKQSLIDPQTHSSPALLSYLDQLTCLCNHYGMYPSETPGKFKSYLMLLDDNLLDGWLVRRFNYPGVVVKEQRNPYSNIQEVEEEMRYDLRLNFLFDVNAFRKPLFL